MTAFAIRSYAAADDPGVIALWREAFPDDPPWNEPTAVIARKLTVQPELFLVAELHGEVVGVLLAGFDGTRGWIHHLAVAVAHRRTGIGRALMTEAEAGLRRLGCPKVNLQVRATDADVVRFYERLGYTVEVRVNLGKRLLS